MALAFYEAESTYEAAPALSPDESEHVRTYRKFVRYMTIAACAVPFFVAFLLHWTT